MTESVIGADYMTRTSVYLSSGLLRQLDAGGDGQVVGVTSSSSTWCLRSDYASSFKGTGSVSWSNLSRVMKYISCGKYGCWGIDTNNRIFFTQVWNCSTSDILYLLTLEGEVSNKYIISHSSWSPNPYFDRPCHQPLVATVAGHRFLGLLRWLKWGQMEASSWWIDSDISTRGKAVTFQRTIE